MIELFIEVLPPANGPMRTGGPVRAKARTASALNQPNVVTIQRMRSRVPAASVIHRDLKPGIMPTAAPSSEVAVAGTALLSLRSAGTIVRKP